MPNNAVVDGVFNFLADGISFVLKVIVDIFLSNNIVAFIVFMILINLLAIVIMKKDKKYSKNPEVKRVRESTLLIIALVGGALGEYYAMYKFKHKTLHRKFTIGVPMIITLHFALFANTMFMWIAT